MTVATLSVLLLGVLAFQEKDDRDPISKIRSFADRGDVADAIEAAEGLPEPARWREEAYVRLRARDLDGCRRVATEAVRNEANDSEMLRILGDVASRVGRLKEAAQRYRAARAALPRDARVSAPQRAAMLRWLDSAEKFIDEESAYRDRVRSAERTTERAALIACVLLAGLAGTTLSLGSRHRS